MPRLKQDGYAKYLKDKEAIEKSGGTFDPALHEFKPHKLWDYVYMKVLTDTKWWMQQIEMPALRIVGAVNHKLSDYRAGDAPVAQAPSGARRTPVADPVAHMGSYAPPAPAPQARPKKKARIHHNVSDDGNNFISTRTGIELCVAFNQGTCKETTGNNFCAANPQKLHLCSKCLQPRHTALQCNQVPTENSASVRFQKGKGKGGKGKGKGKSKGGKSGKGWWGY